jgi:hypothetical protein
VSTVIWFLGFGLMIASFTFLFGKTEDRDIPRISVEGWPDPRNRSDEARR